MTMSLKAFGSDGVRRKVLFWRDDDEHPASDGPPLELVPTLAVNDDAVLASGVQHREIEQKQPIHDVFTALAALTSVGKAHGQIYEYTAALTGSFKPDITYTSAAGATYSFELKNTVGDAASVIEHARTYASDVARMFNAESIATMLVGYRDLYSSALTDLTNISLTIESINQTMREMLRPFGGAHAREHTFYGDVAEEFDWSDLTYTDRLGDLPPLARECEDVDVVIVGEEEMKPRVYTDEDFQVWGD